MGSLENEAQEAVWDLKPFSIFFLGLFQNQIEFSFERFPHESKTKALNQIKKCKRMKCKKKI
jgi:hypothetical protein